MLPSRKLLLAIVCALGAFVGAASAAGAATGYVRVSEIGYEAATSMRAYLMSTSPVSGETFTIENASGETVASGSVGAETGGWNVFTVYPIDFSIGAAGTYTISVGGAVSATSPAFPVDTPAALYATPLSHALSFHQNERDGPDFISSPLRTAAGHLNDAVATVYATPTFDSTDSVIVSPLRATGATIDAAGGWWDAGDYLKFVETTSYTVALMEIGVRDFPDQMGAGASTSNFTAEARFGLDWLQEMWNENTQTLYYQVGVGSDFKSSPNIVSDHDIWRLPQADDTYGGADPDDQYIRHRPVFVAGAAGARISPNLAGRLAADFALCFVLFKTSDAAYADRCLRSAETVFDLADTSPGQLLTTAPYSFYPEVAWQDDLELGATELYFALRSGGLPPGLPHAEPGFYLARAADWAHAYIDSANDGQDTLNLYDVSGLAHFELYRAIALAGSPTLRVTPADLTNDIANQLAASRPSPADPFDSGYVWSQGDTASHIAGLSVMAKEYAFLTGDAAYETDSRRWLANNFGANSWGVSFIIGVGSTFTDCPQHQVANLVGSLDGGAPVLAGAAVEGPNSAASSGSLPGMRACFVKTFGQFNGRGAVFQDNVQSYTTTEPAIDLTATSMLMYSWRIAGAPRGAP